MTSPVRFMNNNFVTTGNLSSSSTQTNFPRANAVDDRRSKVAKTQGNFEITSSNTNLFINDGAPKTVAITVGLYNFAEEMASRIETDLNAASSGWTVTYDIDTTFKFTIVNSGSVTLVLSSTSNSIWDTIDCTGTTDRTGTSFLADEQRNHSYERYVVDLLTPQEVTFFAVIGPLDEVFTLSDEGTAKLMGNNVDLWDSPNYEQTLTNDPRGLMRFTEDDTDFGAHRYWAFEFEDRRNPIGPEGFKLGHLYFGTYDTITSSNIARGFSKAQRDPTPAQTSESGVRFFDTRSKFESYSGLEIQNISLTDMKVVEQIYNDQGLSAPFFLSLDPALALTDVLSDETRYVTFDRDIDKTQRFLRFWDLVMDVREDI